MEKGDTCGRGGHSWAKRTHMDKYINGGKNEQGEHKWRDTHMEGHTHAEIYT